jgi:hypothetical protein
MSGGGQTGREQRVARHRRIWLSSSYPVQQTNQPSNECK